MKFICIILARKNSKRIKNKNIKILNDRHLIEWTIDFAKQINIFKNIILSTDSHLIREIGLKKFIECKKLRRGDLAKDDTKSIDVVFEIIKNIEKTKNFILLQPTSPFRSKQDILKAIQVYKSTKKNIYSAYFEKKISKVIPNGNFYIFSKKELIETGSFISDDTLPYLQRGHYNTDIDILGDFQKASMISKQKCFNY